MSLETVEIQPFEALGLRFGGGAVSKDIVKIGGRAYELSVGSLTHAEQAALYYAGFCVKHDIDIRLPDDVKKAVLGHYNAVHKRKGFGNWNWDGIDYDADVKLPFGIEAPEGYDPFLWIPKPKWTLKDGIYVPEADKEEPFVAVLPPNGYGPVPTIDGFRNGRTGWAIETRPSREETIRLLAKHLERYMEKPDAERLAQQEVSYSHRRNRGNGKAAVFRGFSADDDGPFCENAGWDGGGRFSGLGAFSLG